MRGEDERKVVGWAVEAVNVAMATTFELLQERPDEIERVREAIDFLAKDARGVTLAIEHTKIEPFEGFIQVARELYRDLGPIRDEVVDALPRGFFQLTVPYDAAGLIRPSHARVISTWVLAVAPTLGVPPLDHFAVLGESLPYTVRLFRFEDGPNRLTLGLGVALGDPRLEESKLRRWKRLCNDRLAKLADARVCHDAAVRMLVLENLDVSFTNPYEIGIELERIIEDVDLVPEVVCLVAPYPTPPLVWLLRSAAEWRTQLLGQV